MCNNIPCVGCYLILTKVCLVAHQKNFFMRGSPKILSSNVLRECMPCINPDRSKGKLNMEPGLSLQVFWKWYYREVTVWVNIQIILIVYDFLYISNTLLFNFFLKTFQLYRNNLYRVWSIFSLSPSRLFPVFIYRWAWILHRNHKRLTRRFVKF